MPSALPASAVAEARTLLEPWRSTDAPGCAVAVAHHRQTLIRECCGLANLEYQIPIVPDTVFHVASVSKQFTAFAVALLAESSALDLDDPVSRYVSGLHPIVGGSTLRQLIHHTSGVRDQWELALVAGWRPEDVITTDDILEQLRHQTELNFEPGTAHAYSNSGYTLLGLVVRAVSGQSLRDFCAERIFLPLEMSSTHFHDNHTEIVPGRAYSYRPDPDGRFHHVGLSYATVGATNLLTTIDDLLRWDANFDSGKVGGAPVLARMHEPARLADGRQLPYAFGLTLDQQRGARRVQHSGGDAGFRCHVARYPDHKLTVVVLANHSALPAAGLAHAIGDVLLRALGAPDDASPRQPPTAGHLDGYAGRYADPDTGSELPVSVEDGRLRVGRGPVLKVELIGADRFDSIDVAGLEVVFTRREQGTPTVSVQIIGTALGGAVHHRIDPAEPSREQLAEYCGRYVSSELDVAYTIELDDDALLLRRRRLSAIRLSPTVVDGFAAVWADTTGGMGIGVLFERGDTGAVDTLLLSTVRNRRLRLSRQRC
ncbi:MAG: serine hydrolase domain-containing protein [Mycobacteriales bacterium]